MPQTRYLISTAAAAAALLFSSAASAQSTNGIVINAGPNDDVQLIGLDISGPGPGSTSTDGITMLSAGHLLVDNCTISGFANSDGTNGAGILIAAQSGAHIEIANSVLRNNTLGVSVSPPGGVVNGVLIEHSLMEKNAVAALSLVNAGAVVVLNGDWLTDSPASISNPSGGQVISYGNNMVGSGGSPTSIPPLE